MVDDIIMLIFSQLTKTNENNESQSDWKTARASWYSVRGHTCGSHRDQRTTPPAHSKVCCSSETRGEARIMIFQCGVLSERGVRSEEGHDRNKTRD